MSNLACISYTYDIRKLFCVTLLLDGWEWERLDERTAWYPDIKEADEGDQGMQDNGYD